MLSRLTPRQKTLDSRGATAENGARRRLISYFRTRIRAGNPPARHAGAYWNWL